ncbi:MAG: hypothetical protein KDK78_11470, partial [Chlamydiia bacterium]|nr:hypothetical protein [Chlamydiia bacterium]
MSSKEALQEDLKTVQAMEGNMRKKLKYVASRIKSMETVTVCGVPAVNINRPSDTFNTAFGGDIGPESAESVYSYYAERKLPMAWWVGPSSASEASSHALIEAGFDHDELDIGMVCKLEGVPDEYDLESDLSVVMCDSP